MTLNEALSTGLVTTGVGMLIVFVVLAILMCVLMLMKVIFYKDPAKAKAQKMPEVAKVEQTDCDDEELIAVLTAAVAASLNTSTYNLKIKSYRRIDNKAPAWRRAGITDTVNQY